MFLSQTFANTHSTKALRDYFALPESQPTPATLISIASSLRHIEWKKSIQKAKQLLTLFGPRISLHTNALQCLEKAGKKKGPSTALHTDV